MAVNFLLVALARGAGKLVFKGGARKAGLGGAKNLKSNIAKQMAKDLQSIKIIGSADFEVKDLGAKEILKDMKRLNGSSVEVGYPGGERYTEDSSIDVAELAIIHELGTKDGRIPSRPANRMSYDKNRSAIDKKQDALYQKVLRGKPVKTALKQLGVWYEAKLKIAYRRGPFRPIKQSTIDKRRGNSSTPLIDTKSMVNSITSKVAMAHGSLG